MRDIEAEWSFIFSNEVFFPVKALFTGRDFSLNHKGGALLCVFRRIFQAARSFSLFCTAHGQRAATQRLCARTAQATCSCRFLKPLARGIPLRNTFLRIPIRPSVCALRFWAAAKTSSSCSLLFISLASRGHSPLKASC